MPDIALDEARKDDRSDKYRTYFWENTPLSHASSKGHPDCVRALLRASEATDKVGAKIDVNRIGKLGRTALHWACVDGSKEAVDLLLKVSGIDVMVHDQGDWTPLHHAARFGHADIVAMLTQFPGTDVNACDNYCKRSPLHCACEAGHAEVVKVLAYVNGINMEAYLMPKEWMYYEVKTPLQIVSVKGFVECVRALLEGPGSVADVEGTAGYQTTALHMACEEGRVEVVRMLLSFNAEVCWADSHEKMSLHYASSGGNTDCWVAASVLCSQGGSQ